MMFKYYGFFNAIKRINLVLNYNVCLQSDFVVNFVSKWIDDLQREDLTKFGYMLEKKK